ncbi:hypothetical protein BH23BAC2_BH23BAC2_22260 [soil metagenome]
MYKLNFKKWYNSRTSVEILLLMMPPLGLYALYRNRTIRSRTVKMLYAIIGLITNIMLLMLISKNF